MLTPDDRPRALRRRRRRRSAIRRAGHLTVVAAGAGAVMPPIRTRLAADAGRRSARSLAAALRRRRRWSERRTSRWRASSIARSRSPTTSTRRSSSSPGCRACSRRRWSAPRWRPPASSFRRCCATRSPRPTRSASRAARRSARCWRSRFTSTSRSPASPSMPLASFAGSLGALGDRLRAGDGAPPRPLDDGAAARRRDDDGVLLGADRCSCSTSPTSPNLPHRALADGDRSTSASYAPIVAALPIAARRLRDASRRCRASLDLISLGADSAAARGVNVARAPSGSRSSARRWRRAPRCRWRARSAFVGIVVPHLVRLVVGSDHRLVLPASALFGAAFLIGCDSGGAHDLVAGRAAGRHRHGDHRRTVFPVAAGEE